MTLIQLFERDNYNYRSKGPRREIDFIRIYKNRYSCATYDFNWNFGEWRWIDYRIDQRIDQRIDYR